MPSELQRVAQALVAALDEAPRVVDYLLRTAQKCRENAGYVGHMSNNPAAQMAAMQLDEAARRCEEAAHYLAQAPPKARGWAEQMVSGVRTAGPSSEGGRPSGPAGRTPPAGSRRENGEPQSRGKESPDAMGVGDSDNPEHDWPAPKLDDDTARDLLGKLPIRRHQPGHREKTSGSWRDSTGHVHRLISGVDRYREIGDRFALEHKLGDPPHSLSVTSHVEVKFALFMRERGLRDEAIVINKGTCDGRWSCEEMLKDFLPPGSRLMVYGPDGIGRPYYGKDA